MIILAKRLCLLGEAPGYTEIHPDYSEIHVAHANICRYLCSPENGFRFIGGGNHIAPYYAYEVHFNPNKIVYVESRVTGITDNEKRKTLLAVRIASNPSEIENMINQIVEVSQERYWIGSNLFYYSIPDDFDFSKYNEFRRLRQGLDLFGPGNVVEGIVG